MRRVEAEGARLKVVHHRAVIRTTQLLAEESLLKGWLRSLRCGGGDDHKAFAELQRRLHRIGEAAAILWRQRLPLLVDRPAHDEAVHHHLNAVSLLLVEFRRIVKVIERPVDAHATEARLPRGVEEGLPFTLPVAEYRAKDK